MSQFMKESRDESPVFREYGVKRYSWGSYPRLCALQSSALSFCVAIHADFKNGEFNNAEFSNAEERRAQRNQGLK